MTNPKERIDVMFNRPPRVKKWLSIIVVAFLVIWSFGYTGFSLADLMYGLPQMGELIKAMVPPSWSYFSVIWDPMLDTIRMAIVGTFIGAILSIPISLLCARNITTLLWLSWPMRLILNIVRTIPELLLAALFVAIIGIGQIPGVMVIVVLTVSIVSKLMYESLEGIEPGPLEAMTAVGSNKVTQITYGVVPQALPIYLSYVLYAFEINVRAAAVLGLVGAGGIGLFYDRTLGLFQYPQTAVIILLTLLIVILIDFISSRVRERLL
ncbi:phosphonate ABC transporter, permease protein PhnE [Staphylococcus felis]|uniref:phosphonate ABC transporter, permease protein PhnE n=1 Tax=Staphylococcus felis TaxID=46127 RepID=UPI000E23A07D|nr:phosphonate ABC transporter, permease protein PhnE [Staphylococcus felis]